MGLLYFDCSLLNEKQDVDNWEVALFFTITAAGYYLYDRYIG